MSQARPTLYQYITWESSTNPSRNSSQDQKNEGIEIQVYHAGMGESILVF
jgi:hypothetical protein